MNSTTAASFVPRRAAVAERAGRQQHERRAQALAAARHDVFGHLADQHHVGVEARADHASTCSMSAATGAKMALAVVVAGKADMADAAGARGVAYKSLTGAGGISYNSKSLPITLAAGFPCTQ